MSTALTARDLSVRYGAGVSALRGVTLEVPVGHCVGVLGSNGAGKTTLLRAIAGLLGIQGGRLESGRVEVFSKDLTHKPPHVRVKAGLAQVPESRRILADFSVRENLMSGALSAGRSTTEGRLDEVFALFPILRQRLRQPAGLLSGGEQQTLAIGRALMSGPRLLLMDEPSLGLAPQAIAGIEQTLRGLLEGGLSILLVEQNAGLALNLSSRIYVLEHGEVTHAATPAQLASSPELVDRYLGAVSLRAGADRLRTEARRSR